MKLEEIEDGWYYLCDKTDVSVCQKFTTKAGKHYLNSFDDFRIRVISEDQIKDGLILITAQIVASPDKQHHFYLTTGERPELA